MRNAICLTCCLLLSACGTDDHDTADAVKIERLVIAPASHGGNDDRGRMLAFYVRPANYIVRGVDTNGRETDLDPETIGIEAEDGILDIDRTQQGFSIIAKAGEFGRDDEAFASPYFEPSTVVRFRYENPDGTVVEELKRVVIVLNGEGFWHVTVEGGALAPGTWRVGHFQQLGRWLVPGATGAFTGSIDGDTVLLKLQDDTDGTRYKFLGTFISRSDVVGMYYREGEDPATGTAGNRWSAEVEFVPLF